MSIKLTTRQKEVLELLSQGYTADQIGAKLNLSGNTIKAHVRLLKAKFGIHHGNSTELVTQYRHHYPAPDRVWMLVAKEAKTGPVRDATAVLLAHLTKDKISIEEMAVRMNRSTNFVEMLVNYGQVSRCTRNCIIE